MNIESRLKAMESIVAQIDEANQAANDRNAPIRWRGGGAEGLLDTLLAYARRIDMFDPQTEMPDRLKHFEIMFCAWGFLSHARKRDPNCMNNVSEEKLQAFIGVFKRYGQKLFDFCEWAKGFMTPDGKLDQAKLLLHRNDCPVMV